MLAVSVLKGYSSVVRICCGLKFGSVCSVVRFLKRSYKCIPIPPRKSSRKAQRGEKAQACWILRLALTRPRAAANTAKWKYAWWLPPSPSASPLQENVKKISCKPQRGKELPSGTAASAGCSSWGCGKTMTCGIREHDQLAMRAQRKGGVKSERLKVEEQTVGFCWFIIIFFFFGKSWVMLPSCSHFLAARKNGKTCYLGAVLGGHGGKRNRAEVCDKLNDIKLLKKREERGASTSLFTAFMFIMVFSACLGDRGVADLRWGEFSPFPKRDRAPLELRNVHIYTVGLCAFLQSNWMLLGNHGRWGLKGGQRAAGPPCCQISLEPDKHCGRYGWMSGRKAFSWRPSEDIRYWHWNVLCGHQDKRNF